MKQVLVTGGTGFLGRPLVQALIARGDQVLLLSRQNLSATKGMTVIQSLDALPQNTPIDTCINLAGESLFNGPWTAAKKRKIRASRLDITGDIGRLNQRLEQPIPIMLSGSATGFYGDKGAQSVTEQTSAGNHFGAQLCQDWESSALQNAALGTRVCLLRTAIVLGAGGALIPMIPLYKWGLGAALGSGKQFWPWIDHHDWLAAVLFCLDHEEIVGPVNLCSPQTLTQGEFSNALAIACHQKIRLPNIPAWLLRRLTLSSSDLLTDSVKLVPEALVKAGFNWEVEDCSKSLSQAVAAIKRGNSTAQP